MSYRSPRLLQAGHAIDEFACSSVGQTEWLTRHARQAHSAGTARVFVVTEADSDAVVAYYAWCMASLSLSEAPSRWHRGAGRYSQPVALLTRLGIHTDHEGYGLGWALVHDVLLQAARLIEVIGCRGILVHSETVEARAFYLHNVPDFVQCPGKPLWLVLLKKDLLRHLR